MSIGRRHRRTSALCLLAGASIIAALLAGCNSGSNKQTLGGAPEPGATIDQTQAAAQGGVSGEEGGGGARLTPTPGSPTVQPPPVIPPVPQSLQGVDLPTLFEQDVRLLADEAQARLSGNNAAAEQAQTALAEHARAIRAALGLNDPDPATEFLQFWDNHLEAFETYIEARKSGNNDTAEAARGRLARFAGYVGELLAEQRNTDATPITEGFTLYVSRMMQAIDLYAQENPDAGQLVDLEAQHMREFGDQLASAA